MNKGVDTATKLSVFLEITFMLSLAASAILSYLNFSISDLAVASLLLSMLNSSVIRGLVLSAAYSTVHAFNVMLFIIASTLLSVTKVYELHQFLICLINI